MKTALDEMVGPTDDMAHEKLPIVSLSLPRYSVARILPFPSQALDVISPSMARWHSRDGHQNSQSCLRRIQLKLHNTTVMTYFRM